MTDKKKISAEEFDRIFDEGEEDVLQYCDLSTARRPNLEQRPLSVQFPTWMIQELEREADRLGINRQAVIKTIIDEGLQRRRGKHIAERPSK